MADKKAYRVLNGINWPNPDGGEHRAERGDEITSDDLPDDVAKGLLAHRDIESLDESPRKRAAKEKE